MLRACFLHHENTQSVQTGIWRGTFDGCCTHNKTFWPMHFVGHIIYVCVGQHSIYHQHSDQCIYNLTAYRWQWLIVLAMVSWLCIANEDQKCITSIAVTLWIWTKSDAYMCCNWCSWNKKRNSKSIIRYYQMTFEVHPQYNKKLHA